MALYSGDLLGAHPSIQELRRLIKKVARSFTRTVLLYGETGTGKGLVARLIHQQSDRAQQPFVDVNCAAIPSSLMESELLGYERGAFTGAQATKKGLVEAADQGTIFLDEIREMDLPLQAKLLSLLDTQQFRRVGSVRPIEVNVRFIAATNRILLREVSEGRFREDLYYRLQVVPINIPPLRERGDDVLILTEHLLRRFGSRYERTIGGLEPRVEEIFLNYRWPGNVRELENLLERIFILEEEDRVLVRHLPARILREMEGGTTTVPAEGECPPTITPRTSMTGDGPEHTVPQPAAGLQALLGPGEDFHAATQAFQTRLIEAALVHSGGNQSEAAARLGLSRHALRHYLLKFGIR